MCARNSNCRSVFMNRDGPQKYDEVWRKRGRGIAKEEKICFGLQPAKAKIMDISLIQTERM